MKTDTAALVTDLASLLQAHAGLAALAMDYTGTGPLFLYGPTDPHPDRVCVAVLRVSPRTVDGPTRTWIADIGASCPDDPMTPESAETVDGPDDEPGLALTSSGWVRAHAIMDEIMDALSPKTLGMVSLEESDEDRFADLHQVVLAVKITRQRRKS